MQPVVTRAFRGLAWLVLVALVLEFYLVGATLFGGTTFQPHRTLGVILAVAILLLLIVALAARPGRRVLGLAALLAVLTIVQAMLPSLRTVLSWVAALHTVNAVALLVVTAAITRAPGREKALNHSSESELKRRT